MNNHKQIIVRKETYDVLKALSLKTGLPIGQIVEMSIHRKNLNFSNHKTKQKTMKWHFEQIVKLAKNTNEG